jgi:riboflavin kinase/FMN adenylyltransferase
MDYGWELEVGFLRKIRDEKKFQSLEELRKQIEFDVQNAQRG